MTAANRSKERARRPVGRLELVVILSLGVLVVAVLTVPWRRDATTRDPAVDATLSTSASDAEAAKRELALADVLVTQGRYDLAEVKYQTLVQQYPDTRQALLARIPAERFLLLADELMRNGQYGYADELYRSLVERYPRTSQADQARRPAQRLMAHADELADEGSTAPAIFEYRTVARLYPDTQEAE